jgi:hypothetical protein
MSGPVEKEVLEPAEYTASGLRPRLPSPLCHDPAFLVVWGVDPQEALHADLSRRTAKDQTTIVSKVAGELIPPGAPSTEAEVRDAFRKEALASAGIA